MRAALIIACLVISSAAWAETPGGYRMGHYRGALPAELPGGRVAAPPEAADMQRNGAVLIDVTPLEQGRFGAVKGRWVQLAEHETALGALWLPNVGLGAPPEDVAQWFRRRLQHLRSKSGNVPLVFFCRADCWMSWNAGKRALEWGFAPVVWMREGIDGWRDHLLPMQIGVPEPLS